MAKEITEQSKSKDYELAFLLIAPEALRTVLDILKRHAIFPFYQSPANQFRLAYPIKKNESAFFGFLCFEALPEIIAALKIDLSLEASIVRFLIVTPVVKSPAREMRYQSRVPESKPEEPASPVLTNEVLEQKLEEILK